MTSSTHSNRFYREKNKNLVSYKAEKTAIVSIELLLVLVLMIFILNNSFF